MGTVHYIRSIYISYRHHCWESFEGSAEVYNELMRETNNYNFVKSKEFLEKRFHINTGANAIGMYMNNNYVVLFIH